MPEKELIGTVKKTWETIKQTLINGVELTFKRVKKSAANKKGYEIENNLPSQACGPQILHIRPSAKESDYHESKNSDRLHSPAILKNRLDGMENMFIYYYILYYVFLLYKN